MNNFIIWECVCGCWWNFFGDELALCLRLLMSQNTDIFALGTNSYTSCPHEIQSVTFSIGKSPPIFCLHGLMLIVRYSVHHVKYKVVVTFHIQISKALVFQLTPHSSVSSDLAFLSVEPLQDKAGQIYSLFRLWLLSLPLPQLLPVCQKIVENCHPLIVISCYVRRDMFECLHLFN